MHDQEILDKIKAGINTQDPDAEINLLLHPGRRSLLTVSLTYEIQSMIWS